MTHAEQLVAEAYYFHRWMFGGEPDQQIIALYVDLHRFYFREVTAKEQRVLEKLVRSNIPLEPMEFVCRRRFPIVPKKVNAMLYLAEAFAKYEPFFSVERRGFIRTCLTMMYALGRTPWIYLRGRILGHWHGII